MKTILRKTMTNFFLFALLLCFFRNSVSQTIGQIVLSSEEYSFSDGSTDGNTVIVKGPSEIPLNKVVNYEVYVGYNIDINENIRYREQVDNATINGHAISPFEKCGISFGFPENGVVVDYSNILIEYLEIRDVPYSTDINKPNTIQELEQHFQVWNPTVDEENRDAIINNATDFLVGLIPRISLPKTVASILDDWKIDDYNSPFRQLDQNLYDIVFTAWSKGPWLTHYPVYQLKFTIPVTYTQSISNDIPFYLKTKSAGLWPTYFISGKSNIKNDLNISPKINSTNYSNEASTSITIAFNESINQNTINSSSIIINGTITGLHTFSYNYNIQSKVLTIDPSNNFILGETVTVTLTTGIKDIAGNGLDGDGDGDTGPNYIFNFTIGNSSLSSIDLVASKYTPGNNEPITITATARDLSGNVLSGISVLFSHTNTGIFNGSNPAITNASGIATISYTPTNNGSHTISATSGTISDQLTLTVGGSAFPPAITVNYPNNEICHDECYIAWSAYDPDNNPSIYLYYDNNNSGVNGTCINPGNPVFMNTANVYVWNTLNMPEGIYWIYAIIDDGTNQTVDYSPGYIEIKHPQHSSDFSYYSKITEEDQGDGDLIIESGESFDMKIRIRNDSYTNTYNMVSSILTTSNQNVTITDNDYYYGDFLTRETKLSESDFDIQIANGFVGDVDFKLTLEFRDANGYEYYQVLDIPGIHISGNVSPSFEVIGIQIVDDGSKCNNNGILNSGETSIEYKLEIRNTGAGKAKDVYCETQPFPSEFKTEISSATYPDISSGSSAWTDVDDHFILHEIPANYVGTLNAQVKVFWADRQFSQIVPFTLEIQPAPWLSYNPKAIDFGIKALGDAAKVPVTLTNYGSSDIIISQIEDLSANSNNWITGASFPLTINPGTSTIIEINIKRDNPENVTEIFRIHSNIHNGITQDIVISGSFYNPLPQGYKKLWESGTAGTDDCNWVEPSDLDGDGLIDLVMYDRNEIFFWEQKSLNSFEFEYKYTYTVPGVDPIVYALQTGNCDGDNKTDIVFRNNDQGMNPMTATLRVIESSGNDQYAQVWSLPISPAESDNLTVGNCDNDTEDEIILGTRTTNLVLMVYERTGDNSYSATWNSGTTIPTYCTSIGYPITGDSDKDGRNELIVIGEDTYIFIWEYSGSYTLAHSPLVTYNPDPNWGDDTYPIIADVDNDNLNEIIISSGGTDGWQLTVFNPENWTLSFHNSTGLYGDFTFPAAADLNGNGIPEMFFGEEESPYRLIVYEFDNGSFFETFKYTTENGNDVWNIKPYDFNKDNSPEVVLSNDNSFMIWGYEQPLLLPDLQIASNNLRFSIDEPTDADTIGISAIIQNIGNANASNIPVEFYLSNPENGIRLDSVNILNLISGSDTTINLYWHSNITGDLDIYVVVDRNNIIEELDSTNNILFKTMNIIDNDTKRPEILNNSYSAQNGDNDEWIEDNENITISWNLLDESGIDSTYILFNKSKIHIGEITANDMYFAVIGHQPPGIYPYEIHANDLDNSSLSSVVYDTIQVYPFAPKIISVYPNDGEMNVPVTDSIVVEFDIAMNPSSINSGTFSLVDNLNNIDVSPVIINYYPVLKKAILNPGMLKSKTNYSIKILSGINGIKDLHDNPLESDSILTFETIEVPYLNISSTTLNIGASENSTIIFDIYSNISWTVSTDQNWLKINNLTGSGNSSIMLTAEANLSGMPRNAALIISGNGVQPQNITVVQDVPYMNVLPSTREVASLAGNTIFEVYANVNWTASSDQNWCTVTQSGNGNGVITAVYNRNDQPVSRQAVITVTGQTLGDVEVRLSQEQNFAISDSLALVALYNSTDGSNWINHENWLTGPLNTWFGVEFTDGRVTWLNMFYNNLTGTIPDEIWNLTGLGTLWLSGNSNLHGTISAKIENLKNLWQLGLSEVQISGPLPNEITSLENLNTLEFGSTNQSGAIPETFYNIPNLRWLGLYRNQYTGTVPANLLSKLYSLDISNNKLDEIPAIQSETTLQYFYLVNNLFTFEDLEPLVGKISNYSYSPQANIGQEQLVNLNEGDYYILSTLSAGSSNQYQWYKNNIAIPGAQSSDYTISSAGPDDAGDYTCEVTNSIVTGLTLYSYPIHVTVKSVINEQNVRLTTGWNIFSLFVTPDNPSMMSLVQPLINQGVLAKVQDEAGHAIEYVSALGRWIDNIGNWQPTESYKIRVTAPASFTVPGNEITDPVTIDLQSGWNIMSYPVSEPQDAMTALDDLITANNLQKVQDETGAAIEPMPFNLGWVNNIGVFEPGEGYKIRVFSNDELTIENPETSSLSLKSTNDVLSPSHFQTGWPGNGYDHMNIYITQHDENGSKLKPGDEIGLFDGDICVGAGYITDTDKDFYSLVASADDPTTTAKDGFTKGNPITIRVWKADQGKELKDVKVVFAEGYGQNFEPEGTAIADLLVVSQEMDNITWLGDAFPNPFAYETTIPFATSRELHVNISIYNMMGQKVTSLADGTFMPDKYSVTWDGLSQNDQRCEPGIYLCRFETDDLILIKRIELIK